MKTSKYILVLGVAGALSAHGQYLEAELISAHSINEENNPPCGKKPQVNIKAYNTTITKPKRRCKPFLPY